MEATINKYRITALITILIMVCISLFLLLNTYRLKDEQHQIIEKNIFARFYGNAIRNDQIYPGGYDLMAKHLESNLAMLAESYQEYGENNPVADSILNVLLKELQSKNPIDSLFEQLKRDEKLEQNFDYLLCIHDIDLIFANNKKYNFFDKSTQYDFIDNSIITDYGVTIGGNLKNPDPKSIISDVSITSGNVARYEMRFTFLVDKNNRHLEILKLSLPTFLLVLFMVIAVVVVYYQIFQNWLRQKQLAEIKSDFVNKITHEFNTPLSTIIVANRSIQDSDTLKDPKNILALTKIIDRQTLHLKKLFNQVMNVENLEKSSLQLEHYKLNDLIGELVADFCLNINEQDVNFQISAESGDFYASLDKFFFTTMLYNLFDNAIKYNDKEIKKLNINISYRDGDILLEVMDNGIGITDEEKELIFDKYYRSVNFASSQISGSGLGLFYIYQCVKSHGWKLSLSSNVNVGSCFTIFIPTKNQPQSNEC